MAESMENDLIASNSVQTTNRKIIRERKRGCGLCVVCGGVAYYCYFGAIACQSCKVFFRRNALKKSKELKCQWENQCEIDVSNRRICSACRLKKCFSNGMQSEMIRSPRPKQMKIMDTNKSIIDHSIPDLIPTLNLLRNDQSTLTLDHWNNLSNLVHCFDEHSGLTFANDYLQAQMNLPPKYRFKVSSVGTFLGQLMEQVQSVTEMNRDSQVISLRDRKLLLHNTAEYTTSFGCAFLFRETGLFDQPLYLQAAEVLLKENFIHFAKRLVEHLDSDVVFLKIIVALMSFFTSNYTVYIHEPPTNLDNAISIFHLENIYSDLVWRYLLYKYGHQQAVQCFSNLIRCFLLLNDTVVQAHEVRQFTEIIDTVVQTTEEKLHISD